MSTRALYTFKGENAKDSWNVYKHADGYPSGAASVIQLTLDYFTWALPRYEADTFAAGFCAAGKTSWLDNGKFDEENFKNYGPGGSYRWCVGGDVRLMPQGDPQKVATTNCSDIEYRYEVFLGNENELRVRAYVVSAWETYDETLLVDCKQADFAEWAKEWENEFRGGQAA
jgi:hypothetical protein